LCPAFSFELDLSGTSPRVAVELEFERAECILAFYPEHFRVLPRTANPIDDIVADVSRLRDAVRQRARRGELRSAARAHPHRAIYLEHLRRVREGGDGPFSLDGVSETMANAFALCDVAYEGAEIGAFASGRAEVGRS
ncbi:MAG TPA: hypothetical protein VE987_02505, partial [Polyangiaceae bacterium]|nr:hypothetical protein [Polyangiaceae bacterium]